MSSAYETVLGATSSPIRIMLARVVGFEPTTRGFGDRSSGQTELYPYHFGWLPRTRT